METIAVLALIIAILSLVVALRTALLNYRLRADEIRRDFSNRVAASLDRVERAKLLLEYVNAMSSEMQDATLLELPSLLEAETSLKSFQVAHSGRPDSEAIGMRNADIEALRAIQEPLMRIERRLEGIRIMLRHGDAKGTA